MALALCALVPAARAQPVPPVAPPDPTTQTAPADDDNGKKDKDEVLDTAKDGRALPPGLARKQLTPEERRQQTEERLRALMVNLGITATATQDAIIVYLAEDEMGHSNVREAEKRLLTGLRRQVPPERMRDLIGDYRATLDGDRARRASAQAKLDVRVGYSLDPKLEATLWLMGVLGEGQSKLPVAALVVKAPVPPPVQQKNGANNAPIYGPPVSPAFGARGEIVGTVTAKGVGDGGEHWIEIRDDSGALDRYAPQWKEALGALDPEVDAELARTALGARVRVQWVWQERRRALNLQPEDAAQPPAPPRTTAP